MNLALSVTEKGMPVLEHNSTSSGRTSYSCKNLIICNTIITMSTGSDLQGGDVCKICKVLATIAHAGIISNTTTGYQDMRQFCFHLENYMLDEISENIVSTGLNDYPSLFQYLRLYKRKQYEMQYCKQHCVIQH